MLDDATDEVFKALAHPARRRMMDLLRSQPGCTVGALCEHFEMSRIGVMKHLRILEDASLVISQSKGRSRLLYVNAMPIQSIYDRWTTDWSALWAQEIAGFKQRVEAADNDVETDTDTDTEPEAEAAKTSATDK